MVSPQHPDTFRSVTRIDAGIAFFETLGGATTTSPCVSRAVGVGMFAMACKTTKGSLIRRQFRNNAQLNSS